MLLKQRLGSWLAKARSKDLDRLFSTPHSANVLSALALLVAVISLWMSMKGLRASSSPNIQVTAAKFFVATSLSTDAKRHNIAIDQLSDKRIPQHILARLRPLETQTFFGEAEFLEALENCIGKKNVKKYSPVLVEFATKRPLNYFEIFIEIENFGSAPGYLTGITWSASVEDQQVQPEGIWISDSKIPRLDDIDASADLGMRDWRNGTWAYSNGDRALLSALRTRTVEAGKRRRLLLRLETGDYPGSPILCRFIDVKVQLHLSNGASITAVPDCMGWWIGG